MVSWPHVNQELLPAKAHRLTVVPHSVLFRSRFEVHFSRLSTSKLSSILSFPGNLSVLLEPVLKAVHRGLDLFSLTSIFEIFSNKLIFLSLFFQIEAWALYILEYL